jgi:hypothetical protein
MISRTACLSYVPNEFFSSAFRCLRVIARRALVVMDFSFLMSHGVFRLDTRPRNGSTARSWLETDRSYAILSYVWFAQQKTAIPEEPM